MLKKIFGIFILTVVALLAVMAGLSFHFNSSPAGDDRRVTFSIARGESLDAIAARLESRGIIRSALFLKLCGRLMGTEQEYRQGNYAFGSRLGTLQIQELIVGGKQVNLRVTIPEGYTSGQMARLLEDKRICPAGDFLNSVKDPALMQAAGLPGTSAEGCLFPDTYLFPEDYPASAVVTYMLNTWREKMDVALPGWQELGPAEIRKNLIIASIIEREYVDPAEAPVIASVFFNRLAIRKPLESCATVVYVMTEIEGRPHPKRLFFRDLDRESPYNTYRHSGLPPGPISNPGLAALTGAFRPAKTDYLYFVLKGASASRHNFSRTFAEHSQATVLYLKGQG